MVFKIIVSDKVGFKVQGAVNDAAGVAQSFDFKLTCKRLDADQIQQKLKSDSDASITEFLVDVIENWSGPQDGEGTPLPYTEDNLRAMCRIPGVAPITFRAYMENVGAKEKN